MHFFITGHTGFKGSWLALWLHSQGHLVSGVALDPEPGSLFESAEVSSVLFRDLRADIRDSANVVQALRSTSPDVVIHLAAQPLVRESYRNPRFTFETNVIGTLNVLEAVQNASSVLAHLVITTDKVYRNVHQVAGYVESDSLGGDDPYSASKAMADLLTHAWVTSFGGPPTAVARAGNVIGGGDVSKDRLIPDIIRALRTGQSPVLRYPTAIRPWQHVIDCLNGYVLLIDSMLTTSGSDTDRGTWNFGPSETGFMTAADVSDRVILRWGADVQWVAENDEQMHESSLLRLDVGKSAASLGWRNLLDFERAIDWTVDWFSAVDSGAHPRSVCLEQLRRFENLLLE